MENDAQILGFSQDTSEKIKCRNAEAKYAKQEQKTAEIKTPQR